MAQREFPLASIPGLPVASLSTDSAEIEGLALKARRTWKVPSGPAPNLVDLLETHGVAVLRLPMGSAEVRYISPLPFRDHPVVVFASDKNDRARSRFDAAHELGHLVMHGDLLWGLPEIEKQAHQFAAAFLMPAGASRSSLPARGLVDPLRAQTKVAGVAGRATDASKNAWANDRSHLSHRCKGGVRPRMATR